jgi:hypothetical protein
VKFLKIRNRIIIGAAGLQGPFLQNLNVYSTYRPVKHLGDIYHTLLDCMWSTGTYRTTMMNMTILISLSSLRVAIGEAVHIISILSLYVKDVT